MALITNLFIKTMERISIRIVLLGNDYNRLLAIISNYGTVTLILDNDKKTFMSLIAKVQYAGHGTRDSQSVS
jgi:hypothetical protein